MRFELRPAAIATLQPRGVVRRWACKPSTPSRVRESRRDERKEARPCRRRQCGSSSSFEKKREIPLGEHSWLTVVSCEDPNGTELSLEPDSHPAVKPFKAALVEDGIPITSFAVADAQAESERLTSEGHPRRIDLRRARNSPEARRAHSACRASLPAAQLASALPLGAIVIRRRLDRLIGTRRVEA